MSARLPNHSFSTPLKVPVLDPVCGLERQHAQDASFPTREGTVGFHREFQGDGSDWVPSGSQTPFPNAHGELPVFREFSMLVSVSAQAPSADVAGPVQPTGVRLRARVSFDLPSSPSPVDPAKEEGVEEDGDSVVFTPLVADRTLISIVTFIYANKPYLVFFLLHLSLCSAGSEFFFQVYPSREVSSVFPSLSHGFFSFEFWPIRLGGGGGGGCAASGSPSRVPALYDFRCSRGCATFS